MKIKTWQERLQPGYEECDERDARTEEGAELRAYVEKLERCLSNITQNAQLQPDARMQGKTDCYAVPLDDVEEAVKLIQG